MGAPNGAPPATRANAPAIDPNDKPNMEEAIFEEEIDYILDYLKLPKWLHPTAEKFEYSPFAPGKRIRMNLIPLILMLVLPWAAFILTCSISAFKPKYLYPEIVDATIVILVVIWLLSIPFAVWARWSFTEPTWYTYLAVVLGIGVIAGPPCGGFIFKNLMEPYYRVLDLKTIHKVDVGVERGDTMLDAGIVDFVKDNYLDEMRSWHFKHHTVYCVAPIVTSRSDGPKTGSYDFWAVGKDCCSTTSADFRCGAWGHPHGNKAIRATSDEDLPNYRLAVQQAETMYGVVSANPVFFKWSSDPEAEVKSWEEKGYRNFLFFAVSSLVASVLLLTIAAWRFAWLGRALSQSDLQAPPIRYQGVYYGNTGAP